VVAGIFSVNRIRGDQASTWQRRQTRKRDAERSAPWNPYPFSTGIAFCAPTISGPYSSPFDTRCGWCA